MKKCLEKTLQTPVVDDLLSVVVSLRTKRETVRFLRDLLTENEIKEFANRFQAARMLSQGISYQTIQKKTGLSSRTVARIQEWLTQGMGGYRLMISRLTNSHHSHIFSSFGKGVH